MKGPSWPGALSRSGAGRAEAPPLAFSIPTTKRGNDHVQHVVAEDHVLVREGIKKIIEALPGLQVVGEVGTASHLLTAQGLAVDM